MGGKPGTMLGRLLDSHLPETSPLRLPVKLVDTVAEKIIFDDDSEFDLKDVLHNPAVLAAKIDIASFLRQAFLGVMAGFDIPGFEGETETKFEQGVGLMLEATVEALLYSHIKNAALENVPLTHL